MANGDEFASFPPEFGGEDELSSFEDPAVLAERQAAMNMLDYLKEQEDMGNFVRSGMSASDEFTRADLDAAKAMQAQKMGISIPELERQQELVNRYNTVSPTQINDYDSRRARSILQQNPGILTGFSEDYLPGGMSTENPLVLQRARDNIVDQNAIQTMQDQQEAQDQLNLAEIRAMFSRKGGTPRGIGVRDFSRQRQQILDDYKEQYAAGQKYEAERRKAAEAEVAKSRQRFEEASDLQGKFRFDPTRVLDSTGDVIAAAIFVGLSGAANAMAGQPGAKNQALEIINGTIDRDIQAQKME